MLFFKVKSSDFASFEADDFSRLQNMEMDGDLHQKKHILSVNVVLRSFSDCKYSYALACVSM